MHPDLEKLIQMAIADGEITEKEMAIILKKAEKLGEDPDEVELILEGELALAKKSEQRKTPEQPKSAKVGDIDKCPACGAPVPAMTLKCSSCGHEFNAETSSSKSTRDSILTLQEKLQEIDKQKIRILGKEISLAVYDPNTLNKKKAELILGFTIPNTKESLIQFFITSYSNYEGGTEQALLYNPVKKAWLAKAIQTYNLLKAQKESDPQIKSIVEEYSFLETRNESTDKKTKKIRKELNKSSSDIYKKVLKRGGIGCGAIFVIYIIIAVVVGGVFSGSGGFGLFGPDNPVDSLVSLGQFEEAEAEAAKITDEYEREQAMDDIKETELEALIESGDIEQAKKAAGSISNKHSKENAFDDIAAYECTQFLENGKIEEARNKANTISATYSREDALDEVTIHEVKVLIASGEIAKASSKASTINSEWERDDVKDQILLIEVDQLISEQDFEGAKAKAKKIEDSSDRDDAIDKIKNAKK